MMGNHRLFYHNPKVIRNALNEATDLAALIQEAERALIAKLYDIDQQKFYVRYGFNSLSGFCKGALKFTKTQTQRLVTQVRRYEPTANFPDRRA